jgi:hypothetical protein
MVHRKLIARGSRGDAGRRERGPRSATKEATSVDDDGAACGNVCDSGSTRGGLGGVGGATPGAGRVDRDACGASKGNGAVCGMGDQRGHT